MRHLKAGAPDAAVADDQPVLSLLTPEQQAILALQPQPEVPPKKATAGRKRKAVGDAFVTVARKMIRAGKPEHKRAALAMVQGVAKEVSESLGIAEEKISSAALQGTSLRGIHRVRRGPKISDAELSQRLDGVTVPSAQWSRRIGKCVRTLQGSKQRCYKDLKNSPASAARPSYPIRSSADASLTASSASARGGAGRTYARSATTGKGIPRHC